MNLTSIFSLCHPAAKCSFRPSSRNCPLLRGTAPVNMGCPASLMIFMKASARGCQISGGFRRSYCQTVSEPGPIHMKCPKRNCLMTSPSDSEVFPDVQLPSELSELLSLELRLTRCKGRASLGTRLGTSGFFGHGRLGRGTGGAPLALLGISSYGSVDDPAGFDPPEVPLGPPLEVIGGGGGGSADSWPGRGGAGMLRHANLMGKWLAIARILCG